MNMGKKDERGLSWFLRPKAYYIPSPGRLPARIWGREAWLGRRDLERNCKAGHAQIHVRSG